MTVFDNTEGNVIGEPLTCRTRGGSCIFIVSNFLIGATLLSCHVIIDDLTLSYMAILEAVTLFTFCILTS